MKRILTYSLMLCSTIYFSACSGTGSDASKGITGSESGKAPKKFHGEADNKLQAVSKNEYISILKSKTLADYPNVKIGDAFDNYPMLARKAWSETRGSNGTYYVDFIGWQEGGKIDTESFKRGISLRGVDVKFVINQNGDFYIGMISKLEATTDGHVSSSPISDIKSIVSDIYANKVLAL